MLVADCDGWVGNDYYTHVGHIRAKDCNFDKSLFKKMLEKEVEYEIELITEIKEGYYRVKKSNFFERTEYGDYCYVPCKQSKGAPLYYFAAFMEKEESE